MEYWKLYSRLSGGRQRDGRVNKRGKERRGPDGSGCKPCIPFSHSIRGMRNDLGEPASRKRCNKQEKLTCSEFACTFDEHVDFEGTNHRERFSRANRALGEQRRKTKEEEEGRVRIPSDGIKFDMYTSVRRYCIRALFGFE